MSYRITGARQYAASAVVALAACVLPVGVSAASNIEIRVGDCRSNVEVEARNVRLSDVLARLAKTLDFKMRMEGADPLINVSMSAPAPEVVAALAAQHGSFMIQHASDSRCPGMRRVSMLWLAPKATLAASPAVAGEKGRHVASAGGGGAGDRDGNAGATAPRRGRCRASQGSVRIYVRLNGKPPPGEPEEAAAP